MALFKLKSVSTILIEDDCNKNILPLLLELIGDTNENLKIFCYEQPMETWKNIFKGRPVQCFKDFQSDKCSNDNSICVIDSVNQMTLELGWNACLKHLINLKNIPNVTKTILIWHRDCLMSMDLKLQAHLNYIANGIVIYDSEKVDKVSVQVKKNGKFFKSEEILLYDSKTNTLKLSPVIKPDKKVEEVESVSPGSLTTFKIETDQINQLEKNKLKLPYMSKINEGKGKVYYEPDAVDDWDDEDPDDDLDI